jgi:hypothetical protein
MRNFQQKRVWRNVIQSTPVLIILGIVLLFFAWSVLGFWNKMGETTRNKKMIEDKVEALREQKEKLLTDIESLNTEEGKERVFRENFGLAKDGEEMIIVIEDRNAANSQKTNDNKGFFSSLMFWQDWFK